MCYGVTKFLSGRRQRRRQRRRRRRQKVTALAYVKLINRYIRHRNVQSHTHILRNYSQSLPTNTGIIMKHITSLYYNVKNEM